MRTQPSGQYRNEAGKPSVAASRLKSPCLAKNARMPLRPPAARASRPNRPGSRRASATASRARAGAWSSTFSAMTFGPRPVQHFGVAAERPRRRARRVQQDRVILPGGFHVSASASTSRALRCVRSRFSRNRARRLPGRIDRRHFVSRGGKLHRFAAGRGTKIEHLLGVTGDQPCGKRRGEVLHPPPTALETGELGDRTAVEPNVSWRERGAAMFSSVSLRLCIVGKGQVERRPLAICRRAACMTSSPQAARHRSSTSAGRPGASYRLNALAQQCAEHPVNQPPRAAVDQRQRGRDQCMVRRAEADLLRERETDHHPRLAVVGQSLARGAVDQRVEVRQPAQRLARDRYREATIRRRQVTDRAGCTFQRLPPAQYRIEDLQCRTARATPTSLQRLA